MGFESSSAAPAGTFPDTITPPADTLENVRPASEISDVPSGIEPHFQANGSEEPGLSLDFELAAGTRREEPQYFPASLGEPGMVEMPPVNSAARYVKTAEVDSIASAKIRPLAQLHDSFIIAVDDEGLLLVDQHVAHERILFDKFRKKETDRPIESQNLLLPETIDLSPAQSEAYKLVEDHLGELGFGLMQLSGRTVAIKSVPTDVPPAEARNLLCELLDAVEMDKRGSAKASLRDNIAASLACKAAVKINMKLTPEKMQWLIDRLLLTSSPTTCPHGRPVILRLTMKDIERGFHRT
jgi:DNA mismatch repair protein MutL